MRLAVGVRTDIVEISHSRNVLEEEPTPQRLVLSNGEGNDWILD
jgi:hypothetical protein